MLTSPQCNLTTTSAPGAGQGVLESHAVPLIFLAGARRSRGLCPSCQMVTGVDNLRI